MKDAVNQFLQDVWNEAVVTNRKDIDSINEIAWQHLGGDSLEGKNRVPAAKTPKFFMIMDCALPNPKEKATIHAFDDTLSSIGMYARR